MARARELGAAVPRHDQPQPGRGRGGPRRRRHAGRGRARPRRPAARTPRWPRWRRPGAGPRRHRRRHPRAVRAHRPHRPVRRRAARGRHRPRRRRRPRADRAGRRAEPSRLRAAGVDVELGVEQAEAEAGALAGWLTGVREHRPFVVWKVAATLDGRVAAADGTSRWITGEEARAAVHRLRATCDAVVVGSRDRAGRRPAAHRPRRRRAAPSGRAAAAAGRRRPPGPARRRPPGCSTTPPPTLVSRRRRCRGAAGRAVRPRTSAGCCSRAARRWPRPSCAPGLVDEVVVHLAPRCSAPALPGGGPGNQHDRRCAVPGDRRCHPPGRGRAGPPAADPAHWWRQHADGRS